MFHVFISYSVQHSWQFAFRSKHCLFCDDSVASFDLHFWQHWVDSCHHRHHHYSSYLPFAAFGCETFSFYSVVAAVVLVVHAVSVLQFVVVLPRAIHVLAFALPLLEWQKWNRLVLVGQCTTFLRLERVPCHESLAPVVEYPLICLMLSWATSTREQLRAQTFLHEEVAANE